MITTLQRITDDLNETRRLMFNGAEAKDLTFMEDEINAVLPVNFRNETETEKRNYTLILHAILVKSIYKIEDPLKDVMYLIGLDIMFDPEKHKNYICFYIGLKRDKIYTYKNMLPLYNTLDRIIDDKKISLKEKNDSFPFFFSTNILTWLTYKFEEIFSSYAIRKINKRMSITSHDYLFKVTNDTPENREINKIFFDLIGSVNNHEGKEEDGNIAKIMKHDVNRGDNYEYNIASCYIISAYIYHKNKKFINSSYKVDIKNNDFIASLLFREEHALFIHDAPFKPGIIGIERIRRQINKGEFSNIKMLNNIFSKSPITLLALKFLPFSNSDDYIEQFKAYLFDEGYTKKGVDTLLTENIEYLKHVPMERIEGRGYGYGFMFLYNQGIKGSDIPQTAFSRTMEELTVLLENREEDNEIIRKNKKSLANILIPYFKAVIDQYNNPTITDFARLMIENSKMDLPGIKETMTEEIACSIIYQVAVYCNKLVMNDKKLFNQCSLKTLCDKSKLWHENTRLRRAKPHFYFYKKEKIGEVILNNVCFSQIINTKGLVNESVLMLHHVDTYNKLCHAEKYVVYHADHNMNRATLIINKETGMYKIDDLYGMCHNSVDSEFHDAAKMLIDLLNIEK